MVKWFELSLKDFISIVTNEIFTFFFTAMLAIAAILVVILK